MRAYLGLWAAGLALSLCWIALAYALGVEAWTRAWWAGNICGVFNGIGAAFFWRSLSRP